MYAIVKVGGSQYKVSAGDVINVDRLEDKEGKKITLDQVLLFADGQDIRVGQPVLKDVKISAEVVRHSMARRVVALKYRRRKDSAVRKGSRHHLTSLSITKIDAK